MSKDEKVNGIKDLDQKIQEANIQTSDAMPTLPETITEEAETTYFETDIIEDIVDKGWLASLWNVLGYNVSSEKTKITDSLISNTVKSESSNPKINDTENLVDCTNNSSEAKTESIVYKGYFARFWEILTFSNNRVEANEKLIELSEVKNLPDVKQIEIKEILSESLRLNSTPEEIIQKIQQIDISEVIGNSSAQVIE